MHAEPKVRMTFRHPVVGKELELVAPESLASAVLGACGDVSREELLGRVHALAVPLEVKRLFEELLDAGVTAVGQRLQLGELFVRGMLDLIADFSHKHPSHVIAAYVGFALADRCVLRWMFSLALSSLYMYLNLDPGFYRKVGDEELVRAVRSRQDIFFAPLDALDFKER